MSQRSWPEELPSPPAVEISFDGHEGSYYHLFKTDRLVISNEATQEVYEVQYSSWRLSEQSMLFRFVKPDSHHLVSVDVVVDFEVKSAFSVHQFVTQSRRSRSQIYIERGTVGPHFRIESLVAFPGWEGSPSRLQMWSDENTAKTRALEIDQRGRLIAASGRALELKRGLLAIICREARRTAFILVNSELNRYTATELDSDLAAISTESGAASMAPRMNRS